MSDESCYYSPGEVLEDEKENGGGNGDDGLLARNLLMDFQDGVIKKETTTSNKPTASNREPMKVFLRIRPFTSQETKASEDQGCLKTLDEKTIILSAPSDSFTFKSSIRGIAEQTHQFSFTKVYDDNTTQKDIFDDSMVGTVKDFLDGINCLIFTYGVTNSGKTFTIQGNLKNGGILPRTLDVLFNSIKGQQYEQLDLKPVMYQDVKKLNKDELHFEELLKKAVTTAGQRQNVDLSVLWKMDTTSSSDLSSVSQMSATSSSYITANDADYSSISDELKERVCDSTVIDIKSQGPVKFCIWVSFAEIYNEYVYDLLDPTPAGKGKKRPVLKLGDDKKGNPYIKGLKEIQVNSADEAFKVLRVGQKNQNIAATKLNQNSSRSHSIFTIKILRVVDVDEPHVVRISRLSFVDLAGSERYCKTQSTGDRLKEASNINTSIMTLGKCIEYLRYNQQHKNHPLIIPFRESKLTRLFQGFFRGKGKACMVVNISQCASVFDETYNVLKFSAIAKQVTTKSVRNTDIFKPPKHLPKPSLSSATPSRSIDKRSWTGMGMTTPRPIQKDILCESMVDDDERFQTLVKSYEELRKQLIDERRKNAVMELKIREEVCSEMSEQIVEIEKNYSERLQEEQQTLEEQCERRIEMLTKSMKKARKKRKMERVETDEDSYVSSVLLHAEKVKVKEQEDTIRALRAKLAEKETAHEFYKQMHTPEQQPKVMKNLKNELDEAKETLNVHGSHIVELQTMLNEAKDALEEKELEVEKLKEIIEVYEESTSNKGILDLKNILEETSKALEEARTKLDGRDDKIREKDDMIAYLQKELASSQKASTSQSEMEEFDREVTRLEQQSKLMHERNAFQNEEIKQLRFEKDEIEASKQSINDKLQEVKRQFAESEDRREQLQFKEEENKDRIRKFQSVVKNHETALAESENIIEQLNGNIKQLKQEIEDLKVQAYEKDLFSEDEDVARDGEKVSGGVVNPSCVDAIAYQERMHEIEDLKLEVARISEARMELEKETRNQGSKIQDLQDQIRCKQAEIENKAKEYEGKVFEMQQAVGKIEEELEGKRKEVCLKHDKVKELEAGLEKKGKEFLEREMVFQNEIKEREFKQNEMIAKLIVKSQELVESQKEVSLKQEQVRELETSIAKKGKEFQEMETAFQMEVKAKGFKIEELTTQLAIKSKESEEMQKEVRLKQEKLKELEEGIERKRNEFQEMETAFQMEVKAKGFKIEELTAQLAIKSKELEEKQKGLEKEAELDSDRMQKKEMTGTRPRIESLKGSKPRLKNESALRASPSYQRSPHKPTFTAMKELEKTLAETTKALEKKNEQVQAKNSKMEELERNIKEMEDEVEILKEGKYDLQGKLEESMKELKGLKSTLGDMNDKVFTLEDDLVQSRLSQIQRKQDLTKMEEDNRMITEERNKAKEEVKELAEKVNKLDSLLEEKKQTVDKLRKDLSASDKKNNEAIKELSIMNEELLKFQNINEELEKWKNEVEVLKGKITDHETLKLTVSSLKSTNEELNQRIGKQKIDMEETENRFNKEITGLKCEVVRLTSENKALDEELGCKNEELGSKINELNGLIEENVGLQSDLCKAKEMVSTLEVQVKLRKTEKELNTMHTKEQIKSALVEASKKDELRIKEMTKVVMERDDVIKNQKQMLEEHENDIEDLTRQLQDAKHANRDLIKKQQTIHDLRCAIIAKDEKLKELTKLEEKILELENKLKDFEEMKFQKETLRMQVETQKRTIKEREQQIAEARREIEKLQKEITKLQEARETIFEDKTPKPTPGSGHRVRKRSSDIPLNELKEMISSDYKKSAKMPNSGSIRRSTRTRASSVKEQPSENEHFEATSSSKKKGANGRKVLFDLNEHSPGEILQVDSPKEKPKRRRKLLAKNLAVCSESPQVIPPSPTKPTDQVTAIVRRQLRSSTRR